MQRHPCTLEAITTRGNGGWRATAPTLRECTVELQMVWKPGDAVFDAIKTAKLGVFVEWHEVSGGV